MKEKTKNIQSWRYACAILSICFSGALIANMVMLIVFAGSAIAIVSFSLFGAFATTFYILSSVYYFLPKFRKGKIVMSRLTRAFHILSIFSINLPMFFIGLQSPLSWVLFSLSLFFSILGVVFYSIKSRPWPYWLENIYYMIFIWLWIIALPQMIGVFSENAIVLYMIATLLLMLSFVFFRISSKVGKSKSMLYQFAFNMIFIFGEICYVVFMFIYL